MTNEQFDQFVLRRFGGNTNAAATELEIHRDTVLALRTGKTRKGSDYPVPRHIELAAGAIDAIQPPDDPMLVEAADSEAELELYNGHGWVDFSDAWFGPDKDTLGRWRRLRREWPSAAKIIAAAVMGYPVRIKGKPATAERVERIGGDAFVKRLP